MCHACIIENVKSDLSRRGLLAGAALAAAGSAISATSSVAYAADTPTSFLKVVDLTHTLTENFPTYFGTPAFEKEPVFTYAENKVNLDVLKYPEHVGTDFDAPIHFSADGATVDEISVDRLVCPLAIVDVSRQAEVDPDYRLTPDDIADYEKAHGAVPAGACVAMLSGWAKHLGTDTFRGADEDGVLHFPGFSEEAARFLIDKREVVGIAVDTMSLDHGQTATSPVHYAWLPTGRYGIENVANLDRLPPTGATLVAGAPKFEGGTGGPGRVMALV